MRLGDFPPLPWHLPKWDNIHFTRQSTPLIPTPRPGCPILYTIILYAGRNAGLELGSKNVNPIYNLSFKQTHMSMWMKSAKVWKQKSRLGFSWTSFHQNHFLSFTSSTNIYFASTVSHLCDRVWWISLEVTTPAELHPCIMPSPQVQKNLWLASKQKDMAKTTGCHSVII